jgi:phospholipid transport system transporter-binding protein
VNPEPQLIKEDAGHYYLRGTVDFNTVTRLTHESILDGSEQVNIDLGGLLSADSSAVALLIQWLRQATQEDVELRFLNIPEQIKPLIALYDLESIIQ